MCNPQGTGLLASVAVSTWCHTARSGFPSWGRTSFSKLGGPTTPASARNRDKWIASPDVLVCSQNPLVGVYLTHLCRASMQTHSSTSQSLNALLAPFTKQFQNGLLRQGASSVPLLTTMSQYYMLQPSKRLRPCLILLMCQATNGLGSDWMVKSTTSWAGCPGSVHACILRTVGELIYSHLSRR